MVEKYTGENPICKHGHDKRVVGITKNWRCWACKLANVRAWRARKLRRKVGFRGDGRAVPGLRAVRKSLGLTQRELARQAGVHYTTVSAGERGKRHLTVMVRRKLERAVKEHGGDVMRVYAELEIRRHECDRGLGHPAWESATMTECPRCAGTRSHVPKAGTVSDEEMKRILAKVPDTARFDHAINKKGQEIRASWSDDGSEALFEEEEAWGW